MVIAAVNSCLVWKADKGFGVWLWIFIFAPLTNLLLMFLGVAFRHLMRRMFMARISSFVLVATCGCGIAVLVDALAILVRAMK